MNPYIMKEPLLYPGWILPDAKINFLFIFYFSLVYFELEVIVKIGMLKPPSEKVNRETLRKFLPAHFF